MAAAEVPANLQLTSVDGQTRTMDEWLITFQMLGVVLDPFTYESSWILETAGRILESFRGASVRTCFVVTGTIDEAKQFCGPWVDRVLVYADPDRAFVKAAELEALPALVHLRQNRHFGGVAQGWEPAEWKAVVDQVARERHWTKVVLPAAGDPGAYPGSPALGTPV
ncbi:MAG: hypothetical protein R2755_30975 [Acidimicrobiales bacterium]